MLDIQLFRENPDLVRQSLIKRHQDPSAVDEVIKLDEKRRALLQQVESLRAEKNQASKAIGKTKDPDERQEKITAMQALGDQQDSLEAELKKSNVNFARIGEITERKEWLIKVAKN